MKLSPGKAAAITSLLLLLIFPNLLVLLAYTVNESILLGILAAISGGLIAAWSITEPEQQQLEKASLKKEIEEDESREDEEVKNVKFAPFVPNKIREQNELVSELKDNLPPLVKDVIEENTREEENKQEIMKSSRTKFIESLLPTEPHEDIKKMLKNHKNQVKKAASRGKRSTRAKRKGVSLLSWFLMKEGKSPKTRRR